MRKPLPFRLYVQILLFSALVACGVLILWPLQQSLYGGIVSIRDNLINRLERRIGRKIRYSSISPSFFGSFDVRNISIMGHDDIPLLTVSRFRIAYSLLDIIRGRTLAIRSVQIDSPLLNYNTATDNDLLDLFRTAGKEGPSRELAAMLPEKIIVRIRNGKCQFFSANDNFALDAIDFYAEIFDKSVALDGKWNIGVTVGKLFSDRVNFQIAMTANGLCRMDLEDGAAIIAIPAVTGDMSGVEPVVFNVSMKEGVVNIYKKPDDLPIDMSFEYGKDGKVLEGRLSCDNFKLAQIVSFSGGLEELRQMLDVASSGAASIERTNAGGLKYSVNLAGSSPSILPFQSATAAGNASYEIDIAGNENLAQIRKFRFSMPQDFTRDALFYGNAGFTGAVAFHPFAPQGVISLGKFSLSGREDINADIAVKTAESSGINLSCETILIGQGVVDIAANASLEPSENGTIFSVYLARNTDKNHDNSAQKRTISLNGSFDSGAKNIDANFFLDSFIAGDLIGMTAPFVKNVPLPDMLMKLFHNTTITTGITFNSDFTRMSYNTPSLVFSGNSGDKGFNGFMSINGTDSSFELDKGQIKRGEDVLLLSARADFARLNNIDFSVNAGYHGISCLIQGTVLDGKTVNILGSYGLKVNFTTSSGKKFSGVINTEGFPVPFLGKPALLFMSANLNYDSSRVWSMDFNRLEMTDMITPGGEAQFRASGRADQNGINLPRLYYKDGFGPLSGNVNLLWSRNNSDAISEINGTAFLADNNENCQMEISYSNRSLNLGLSGTSIRLGRFSEKANTFQADGQMRLSWDSIHSFNGDLNLSSLRGKVNKQDFNISAQAVIDGDELTLRRIAIKINTTHGEIPQIVVNNKTGTAGSAGNLKLLLNGKRTEGLLSVSANFKPVNSWLEIKEALEFFDGKAHVENFRLGEGAEPQTFDIAFTRTSDNSLSVSGGPRNMFKLHVDNKGNFYAGLSSPSPVRGTAVGNISNNIINASCNDLFLDMEGVFKYLLFESKEIYLTGGYVNGSLDIRGPLSDPEFFGSVRGTSLRFVIPSYIPVEVRPIPCTAVVEGNEIRLGQVLATAGKGACTVSGRFIIDRWIPDIFSIDITIPRETPVPYSLGVASLAARGDASGKLKISMENLILDVSGDMYVNNTVLGMDADDTQEQFSGDSRTVVDLTVSSGPVVEFCYPKSNFPVVRVNPDMGAKLHVTADTITRQYSVTGDIKIRGGELFYFERSFYIRSGLLVLRENELRFSPRLTARAETRDRNEDGPVTISLIVDNAPLFDFTARFESSPPLSQMEILALMGQSLPGSQIDEGAGTAQKDVMAFINTGVDMLGQIYVVRQGERVLRNFLRLDMFSVRTQVLQNLIFRGTGLMQQPVDRTALGNYLDNTTFLGGKYIGPDMYIQGMLTMRYDANKNTTGGLFDGMTFQPDIGFELQGPVVFNNYNFRIRWSFLPEHPENWWANDNSVTFTFSKSF